MGRAMQKIRSNFAAALVEIRSKSGYTSRECVCGDLVGERGLWATTGIIQETLQRDYLERGSYPTLVCVRLSPHIAGKFCTLG